MLHVAVEKAVKPAVHEQSSPQKRTLSRHEIEKASSLLKALANESRLTILYLLRSGEKSVLELGRSLNLRQPTVSQHLARLREERIVETRRDGQVIYYSIASTHAREVVDLLEKQAE